MKILIRGGHFVNKGAEAMIRTVQSEIAKRIPNASFHALLPEDQEELGRAAGLRVSVWRGGKFRKTGILAVAAIRDGELRKLMMKSRADAFDVALNGSFDGVLDVSGFLFTDSWGVLGVNAAKNARGWVDYCLARRRPYVFLPQAWGPFSDPAFAESIRGICRGAAAVYARDTVSRGYLVELLGQTNARIELAPDIAFRFQGGPLDEGSRLLESHGLKTGANPIVGISPNMRVYERVPGTELGNAYIRMMVDTARMCISELGASVVLVPHEIQPGAASPRDDRFLCRMIAQALGADQPVAALCGEYTAETLKAVIGNLDLLVGSRFHSLVFALASGVPCVAAGWSHKYPELLALVGMEKFALGHPQETSEKLLPLVRQAWRERAEIRRSIGERLPGVHLAVDKIFDRAAELLLGSS
jgi:colanic acid/amylovoran biosynthesis protein